MVEGYSRDYPLGGMRIFRRGDVWFMPLETSAYQVRENTRRQSADYEIRPILWESASLGEPIVSDVGRARSAQIGLSSSGRYWIKQVPITDTQCPQFRKVLDLQTGEEYEMGRLVRRVWRQDGSHTYWDQPYRWVRWMSGDRLLWVESNAESERLRVYLGIPGGEQRMLGEFQGTWADLNLSPSGRHVIFNNRWRTGKEAHLIGPDGSVRKLELSRRGAVAWLDGDTLFHRRGHGHTGHAVEDLDSPGELRWIYGGPREEEEE